MWVGIQNEMSHKNCQCFSYQPWLLDVANNILGKLDNEKIVCFQMCHDKSIHIFFATVAICTLKKYSVVETYQVATYFDFIFTGF